MAYTSVRGPDIALPERGPVGDVTPEARAARDEAYAAKAQTEEVRDDAILQTDAIRANAVAQTEAIRASAQTAATSAAASAQEAQNGVDSITRATWADLNATPGTRSGQRGIIPAETSGTHTDPVVGGTVPNAGLYTWQVSPAGWRRVGDVISPAATTAAINLNSIGVLSATAVPALSGSSWTVGWTQARAVWSGQVITINDLPATTLASGETLFVDLVAGTSPYTAAKAATSAALRADFAAGRKLQLLYNQTGSLVGAMAPILLAFTGLVRYDPAEIVVTIATNNVFSVAVKASADPSSTRYIRYRMELVQTPDDGSARGQADIWSLQGIYEMIRTGPTTFTQVRELCDQGNIELAIRESGRTDSMGGAAHGDHKKKASGLTLWIDGKAVSLTPSQVVYYRCKTVSFLQSSTLYRADTVPPASVESADIDQRWEWEAGALDLYTRVRFKIVMTLNFAMLGMLPVNRLDKGDSNFVISSAAVRFAPILFENVSTDSYSRQETEASTMKLQGPNGHGFELAAIDGWTKSGRKSYVSPDPTRNKAYLDYCGNGYTTSVDEVLESRVRIRMGMTG